MLWSAFLGMDRLWETFDPLFGRLNSRLSGLSTVTTLTVSLT